MAETAYHTARLNHERFKKDQGEIARATWRYETDERVPFDYWLYSLYEPKEDAPMFHKEPSITVQVIGPGVFCPC